MSQKDTLKLLLPSADEYDDAELDSFLELAQGRVSESVFGDQYDYAVALMACHIVVVSKREGMAGRQTSMQEGSLSVGFNVVGLDGELSTTSCGVEFQHLKRSLIMGARSRLV